MLNMNCNHVVQSAQKYAHCLNGQKNFSSVFDNNFEIFWIQRMKCAHFFHISLTEIYPSIVIYTHYTTYIYIYTHTHTQFNIMQFNQQMAKQIKLKGANTKIHPHNKQLLARANEDKKHLSEINK